MKKITQFIFAVATIFITNQSFAEYRFNYALKSMNAPKENTENKRECFVSGAPAFYVIESNHPGYGIYHKIAWNDQMIQDYGDLEIDRPTTLPIVKDGYSYTKGSLFWESDPVPGSSFYERDYEVCRQPI